MSKTSVIFARRLREERRQRGLTQVELAERALAVGSVGLTVTAITNIERRVRDVKIDEAVALAGALDIPLEWLLTDGPAQPPDLITLRARLRAQQDVTAQADHDLRQSMAAEAEILAQIERLEEGHGP